MYPSSQRKFPKSFVSAEKSLEKVCGRYGIGLENHTHDGLDVGRVYCGYRSACARIGVYVSVQDYVQDKPLLVLARSCPKVKPAASFQQQCGTPSEQHLRRPVISVHENGTRN